MTDMDSETNYKGVVTERYSEANNNVVVTERDS